MQINLKYVIMIGEMMVSNKLEHIYKSKTSKTYHFQKFIFVHVCGNKSDKFLSPIAGPNHVFG
jgi:hypothetical protein